jgi:hypothetical protein
MTLLKRLTDFICITAGCTEGRPLWGFATVSHLHSLPETQKMILASSETTEEEEKQSNGEMRVHNDEASFATQNIKLAGALLS